MADEHELEKLRKQVADLKAEQANSQQQAIFDLQKQVAALQDFLKAPGAIGVPQPAQAAPIRPAAMEPQILGQRSGGFLPDDPEADADIERLAARGRSFGRGFDSDKTIDAQERRKFTLAAIAKEQARRAAEAPPTQEEFVAGMGVTPITEEAPEFAPEIVRPSPPPRPGMPPPFVRFPTTSEPQIPEPESQTSRVKPPPGHEDNAIRDFGQSASKFASAVYAELLSAANVITRLSRQVEDLTAGREMHETSES